MYELIIDNTTIPIINGDRNVSINYAICDFKSMNSRLGYSSDTIKLPKTKEIRQLLGYPDIIESIDEFKNNSDKSCEIRYNGITMLRGKLKLESINEYYNISIMAGNADWSVSIRDLSLKDIFLRDKDHVYNMTNANTANSGDLGYKYPVIDYGLFVNYYDTEGTFDSGIADILENKQTNKGTYLPFYPAVQVKMLMERIFKEQGYTIESNFNDNVLSKIYLPHIKNKIPISETFIEERRFLGGANTDRYVYTSRIDPENYPNTYYLQIDTAIKNDSSYELSRFFVDNVYSAIVSDKGTMRAKITAQITLNIPVELAGRSIWINMTRYTLPSGATPTYDVVLIYNEERFINDLLFIEIRPTLDNIDTPISSTNTITIKGTTTNISPQTWKEEGNDIQYATYLEIIPFNEIQAGMTMKLNNVLPDITQYDFISDIKNIFNLYFFTDNNEKKVYFEPRDDFFKSLSDASEWTDKIDMSQDFDITLRSENFNKKINFTYVQDTSDEYVNNLSIGDTIFAQREVTLENITLSGESDINVSKIAPTYNAIPISSDKLRMKRPIPRLWAESASSIGGVNFKPRLLYYDSYKSREVDEIIISNIGSVGRYAYMYFYDNINSGNFSLRFDSYDKAIGLVDRYYYSEIYSINNAKIIEIRVKLSLNDIVGLDPRKPIKIKDNYFYLSEIKSYNPGASTTECTLLQVVNNGVGFNQLSKPTNTLESEENFARVIKPGFYFDADGNLIITSPNSTVVIDADGNLTVDGQEVIVVEVSSGVFEEVIVDEDGIINKVIA